MTIAEPVVPGGVIAAICVGLATETPVASTPPMLTVAPLTKLVPVIEIAVPPAAGPEEGKIWAIASGMLIYLNPLVTPVTNPPGLETSTGTVAATPGGVVVWIWFGLTTVTLEENTPPKLTVTPGTKPVPVIVTTVPPLAGPEIGETLDTSGEESR